MKKTKTLRKNGLIPAELYGSNIKNIHLSIPEKDFIKLYKEVGEHAIIQIVLEDGKKMPALISKIQYDTLHEKYVSVDFRHVKMDEKISATIPIILKGEAPAIKSGFVLFQVLHELPIESLPGKIPNEFYVDISGLTQPGDSISIKDLNVDKDIKILTNEETSIIAVHERKVKKEEEKEEAESEEEKEEDEEEIKKETQEDAKEKKE